MQDHRWKIALLLVSTTLSAQDDRVHGPFLQWHRDPTSATTFSWVERLTPDIAEPPVWRQGRAGFGFGDQGDGTRVHEQAGRHPCIYIATEFEVPAGSANHPLRLLIDYDDAFVAYLNGIEIARSPNIRGEHHHADVRDTHDSGEEEEFVIANPRPLFKPGKNLLAIEGHNSSRYSRDFTLDPVLKLGNVDLVPESAMWHYLAGADPSGRWFLQLPAVVPDDVEPAIPDALIREKSPWEFGVRLRGSGTAYTAVKVEDSAFGETEDAVFFARIDKLFPDTAYEYVLSSRGTVARRGWFRTAPAKQRQPIEFIVGGDMGTAAAIPLCRLAGKLDPMFVLVGGDLAYANGRDEERWFDWIDNWADYVTAPDGRAIPIIAGIGNHEMKSLRVRKKDAPFYYSLFDLPDGKSNFTVDFGDYLSIVLLDSNHSQRVRSQNLWLGLQLTSRHDLPHLFAIYHRPGWGTGIKRNSRDVQQHWSPLFEKHGVDCAFENDHHCYKRSHKITGGVPDEENGILYIGDGAWGARLRETTPEMIARSGASRYLAEWRSVHHFVKVTANPDGSKRYQAMTADGEIFDEYFDARPALPR